MATKNIIKFLLRLLVAAAIVAGAYFGIRALTAKKDTEVIINTSMQNKIEEEYKNSYDILLQKTKTNTPAYIRISTCGKINDVLLEYYDYYLTLSSFENKANDGRRDEIVKSIKELKILIEETSRKVSLLKTDGLGEQEFQARWLNAANAYLEQTKALFKLDDMLQLYVYEVNYGLKSTGVVYEAQLEMIKDYSKVVFDKDIVKNIADNSEDPEILTNSDSSSFASVINKFINRQKVNKNGNVETNFANKYMEIDLLLLTPFYACKTSAEKQAYLARIEDFTNRNLVDRVYQYINQSSF